MTIERTSFLHFNDVYNVDKSPPFVRSIKKARSELSEKSGRHVVTMFSGDAFSPSIMSTIVRGKQMVPVLNALDIDVACLGNHDLDFGIEEFRELKDECNFPWLCSNAWDSRDDEPLGGCAEYLVVDKSTDEGGPRLLVVGLVEQGWLDTLSSVDPGDVVFEAPADFVQRRVPELTAELGPFDAVVALTHMRMPNDIALAESGGVDIILGGHDHHYEDIVVNGVRILNSGADFGCYSIVDATGRTPDGKLQTASRRVNVTPQDEPDEDVAQAIKKYQDIVNESMDVVVGRSKVRLDARFSQIRTKETNISNFLAELMTRSTGADIAILNAGSIRADRFVEAGTLTMRDLCDLLPMADENMVVELNAERLLSALENGVSQYPAMEGRFPCVDGVRFAFDPSKPPGSRIVPGSVYVRSRPIVARRRSVIRGQPTQSNVADLSKLNLEGSNGDSETSGDVPKGFLPLDFNRTYTVCSKSYLISGKDGFEEAFVGAPVIRESEDCPLLPTMLRNIFTELGALRYWSGITTQGTVIAAVTKFKSKVKRSVCDPYAINPQVDGRIKCLE